MKLLQGFQRLALAPVLPCLQAARLGRVLLLSLSLAGSSTAPLAQPAAAGVVAPAVASRTQDTKPVRLASGALVAADIAQILQRGELVVAMTANDAPPFFYKDGDKVVGTDVSLGEQIAAELKVPLRIDRSAKSFNEVVEIVARGDADLGLSRLSRTLTRAQSVLFSVPYLELKHALILNRLEFAKISRDRPLPQVLRHFSGTLGVIAKSSFADFAVRNFPSAKIVTFPNWDGLVAAVKAGEVVAAYRDEFEVRRILKADPKLALTLRTVTLKDLNDYLSIAVGVRAPVLHRFVNQFLEQRSEKLTVEAVLDELK